jgi:periplasmic copper chaperone A
MRAIGMLVVFVGFVMAAGISSAQTDQLEVSNAWTRATPGHSQIGAAYLTIRSSTADRLVAAATPVAKKAELHNMSMSGMIMKMRSIAAIDVPAGQPVTLGPNGMHIMLMGLTKPLRAGQSFPLTLRFTKAGRAQSMSPSQTLAQLRRRPLHSIKESRRWMAMPRIALRGNRRCTLAAA